MKKLLMAVLLGAMCVLPVSAAETPDTSYFMDEETYREITAMNTVAVYSDYTDIHQDIYDLVKSAMENWETEIDLTEFGLTYQVIDGYLAGPDIEFLYQVYMEVAHDYPEYVYTTSGLGYQVEAVDETSGRITAMNPVYDEFYTEEVMAEFNTKVDEIVAMFDNPDWTDLEKALVVHDYLTVHNTYNREVAMGMPEEHYRIYNAYGTIVDGDSVCDGIADAYMLLMNRLGVPCVYVGSNAHWHAWNMVQLDGNWYHVDATWGDPVPNIEGAANHNYFLLSDETMQADAGHTAWNDGVPECTDKTYEDDKWIFVGNEFATHVTDDGIYYCEKVDGRYVIYLTQALDEVGEVVTTAANTPVVNDSQIDFTAPIWVEDQFLYIDVDRNVNIIDLNTCEETTIGQVPAHPSEDSVETDDDGNPIYDAWLDGLGLEYDAENHQVNAVTVTNPKTLATFDLPEESTEQPACSADAAIRVDAQRDEENNVVFHVNLIDASNIAAVQVNFEAPEGAVITAENGFTKLEADNKPGVVVLCYLQDGKTYTCEGEQTIATITVPGTAPSVKLTEVKIAAYDVDGEPVYGDPVDLIVSEAVFRGCDLNNDGTVNLLDVVMAMKWYQSAKGDDDWDSAQVADVNGDDVVDVNDMIQVVLHYT